MHFLLVPMEQLHSQNWELKQDKKKTDLNSRRFKTNLFSQQA